jgi:7,8-dihydroneopterin aldolase/epimerase/oxygenase
VIEVELHGLELFGHHGAEPEERERGQRFVFDVSFEVGDDALSDEIEDAVDYREVARAVRDVSEGRQFALLEALAAAVADEVLARFASVRRVRVRVRKPEVELDPPVEYSAATAERSRR